MFAECLQIVLANDNAVVGKDIAAEFAVFLHLAAVVEVIDQIVKIVLRILIGGIHLSFFLYSAPERGRPSLGKPVDGENLSAVHKIVHARRHRDKIGEIVAVDEVGEFLARAGRRLTKVDGDARLATDLLHDEGIGLRQLIGRAVDEPVDGDLLTVRPLRPAVDGIVSVRKGIIGVFVVAEIEHRIVTARQKASPEQKRAKCAAGKFLC